MTSKFEIGITVKPEKGSPAAELADQAKQAKRLQKSTIKDSLKPESKGTGNLSKAVGLNTNAINKLNSALKEKPLKEKPLKEKPARVEIPKSPKEKKAVQAEIQAQKQSTQQTSLLNKTMAALNKGVKGLDGKIGKLSKLSLGGRAVGGGVMGAGRMARAGGSAMSAGIGRVGTAAGILGIPIAALAAGAGIVSRVGRAAMQSHLSQFGTAGVAGTQRGRGTFAAAEFGQYIKERRMASGSFESGKTRDAFPYKKKVGTKTVIVPAEKVTAGSVIKDILTFKTLEETFLKKATTKEVDVFKPAIGYRKGYESKKTTMAMNISSIFGMGSQTAKTVGLLDVMGGGKGGERAFKNVIESTYYKQGGKVKGFGTELPLLLNEMNSVMEEAVRRGVNKSDIAEDMAKEIKGFVASSPGSTVRSAIEIQKNAMNVQKDAAKGKFATIPGLIIMQEAVNLIENNKEVQASLIQQGLLSQEQLDRGLTAGEKRFTAQAYLETQPKKARERMFRKVIKLSGGTEGSFEERLAKSSNIIQQLMPELGLSTLQVRDVMKKVDREDAPERINRSANKQLEQRELLRNIRERDYRYETFSSVSKEVMAERIKSGDILREGGEKFFSGTITEKQMEEFSGRVAGGKRYDRIGKMPKKLTKHAKNIIASYQTENKDLVGLTQDDREYLKAEGVKLSGYYKGKFDINRATPQDITELSGLKGGQVIKTTERFYGKRDFFDTKNENIGESFIRGLKGLFSPDTRDIQANIQRQKDIGMQAREDAIDIDLTDTEKKRYTKKTIKARTGSTTFKAKGLDVTKESQYYKEAGQAAMRTIIKLDKEFIKLADKLNDPVAKGIDGFSKALVSLATAAAGAITTLSALAGKEETSNVMTTE